MKFTDHLRSQVKLLKFLKENFLHQMKAHETFSKYSKSGFSKSKFFKYDAYIVFKSEYLVIAKYMYYIFSFIFSFPNSHCIKSAMFLISGHDRVK